MITAWLGEVNPDEKLIRIRIEVCGTGISRTLVVPERLNLEDLSHVIRETIGWDGSHPWMFHQGKMVRWDVEQYEDEPKPKSNAVWYQAPCKHRLSEVLASRVKRLYYVYDFGDNWEHLIMRLSDPEPGAKVGCEATSGVWGRDDVGGAANFLALIEDLRRWDKDCSDDECREGEWSGDLRYWFGWGKKAEREKFLAGPTVSEVDAKIKALFTKAPKEMRSPFEFDDLSDLCVED